MSPRSLPEVGPEIGNAIEGEFGDNPNLISDTYQRLLKEQPELTSRIAEFVEKRARTPEEAQFMAEIYVLTYRMLESQADAQGLSEMFISERPE